MVSAIVLAAGKGTRMKSDLPKVLHQVGDKPMIMHTLDILSQLKLDQILVVVGYKSDLVKKALEKDWNFVEQKNQLGTGHAVKVSMPHIAKNCETILVVNGDDSLFYQPQTIKNFIKSHSKKAASLSVLTALHPTAQVSGRVLRDNQGRFAGIEPGQTGDEVICGLYLFNKRWLEIHLPNLKKSKSGEYLLTDLIELALEQGALNEVKLSDPNEWRSVNTPKELAEARALWRKIHDRAS